MFPKIGIPPKSSIFIGFSILFTIHFGVFPLFLETTHLAARCHFDPTKVFDFLASEGGGMIRIGWEAA